MTIKASSLLAIIVIWAAAVPAVVVEHSSWWSLIFAAMASLVIASAAWRSLGLSRLIAVAGIWGGAALAIAQGPAWVSVFAFLSTGAITFSLMRRSALLNGLGVAVAWLATGAAVTAADGGGAWISVFALLTAASVANHLSEFRGSAAVVFWTTAGVIMVATEGFHWVAVIAWLLSTVSLGIGGIRIPRRIEWDLFEKD